MAFTVSAALVATTTFVNESLTLGEKRLERGHLFKKAFVVPDLIKTWHHWMLKLTRQKVKILNPLKEIRAE